MYLCPAASPDPPTLMPALAPKPSASIRVHCMCVKVLCVSPMPRNSEDTEFASLWEYILCLPASLYTHLWMCAHLCIRVLTVWSPDQQILLAAVVWGRQG